MGNINTPHKKKKNRLQPVQESTPLLLLSRVPWEESLISSCRLVEGDLLGPANLVAVVAPQVLGSAANLISPKVGKCCKAILAYSFHEPMH
jgi:hypothetical protein